MFKRRGYYVYIIASKRRTLYTGVTGNLIGRVIKHKLGKGSVFASKYNCTRLVYCRGFSDVDEAITFEKTVKGWTRSKKLALIAEDNPNWEDLGAFLDESVEEIREQRLSS